MSMNRGDVAPETQFLLLSTSALFARLKGSWAATQCADLSAMQISSAFFQILNHRLDSYSTTAYSGTWEICIQSHNEAAAQEIQR